MPKTRAALVQGCFRNGPQWLRVPFLGLPPTGDLLWRGPVTCAKPRIKLNGVTTGIHYDISKAAPTP